MFDGVPVEQFHHQFISTPASSTTNSSSFIQTPPPISTSTNLSFLSFDPLLFPPPSLLPTHQTATLFQSANHFVRTLPPTRGLNDQYINATEDDKVVTDDDEDIKEDCSWSDDEVIQLLRIKSTTNSQNWFTDFTWDHVSRKLTEMGYKRSAEKCKEKFEEETCRSFSSTIAGRYNKNTTSSSSYLITEEIEEVDEQHDLYINNNAAAVSQNTTHHHHPVTIEPPAAPGNVVNHLLLQEQLPQVHQKLQQEEEQNSEGLQGQKGHFDHKDPSDQILMVQQPTQHHDDDDSSQLMMTKKSKKRKRSKHKRFKMVKGLCVDLVNKMMAQQEEMHKKLLDDIANRDEEKIKREEAWRKEEMERVKREIQIREKEQEMARDRQSTITEYLNKITSLDHKLQIPFDIISFQDMMIQTNYATTFINKQPLGDQIITKQPSSDEKILIPEEDRGDQEDQRTSAKDEIGKRWPREEVLALINIRSNVNNNNNIGGGNCSHEVVHDEHEYNMNKLGGGCSSSSSAGGGSLWERISQGMLELGFKRSAKRCKEKWENINKYFRKTKDANKKRSLDSRTCPYYHELTKLYNQDKLPSSNTTSTSLQPETCFTDKISPTENN